MKQGVIRIIGGKWRGRRLKVPTIKDLRPTPDRVRETLFNWLANRIEGAYCLDVFAGSGALGFEALSRGAKEVVMIDQSREAVALLREQASLLGADNLGIYQMAFPKPLPSGVRPFDIVFLDPPYQENLLLPSCYYLEEQGYLAPVADIYLEAKRTIEDNELPPNWHLIKSKQAGQVAYHLARRELK